MRYSTMDLDKEVNRITEFIKESVEKAGKDGVVLGVSGGLDSAVVAKLCQKANIRMRTIFMPINKHTDESLDIINNICKSNIPLIKTINIEDILNEYPNVNKLDKVSKGNLMARIRMSLLYLEANVSNMLVIGTTNKSEYNIGYFTKWGDGAVDFEPIQHIYKTEVKEFAKYLGVCDEIINKPPSADLWEGQTDEGELGLTYEELDNCLEYLYDAKPQLDKDLDEWKKNNPHPEKQDFVWNLIEKSEHKRYYCDSPYRFSYDGGIERIET